MVLYPSVNYIPMAWNCEPAKYNDLSVDVLFINDNIWIGADFNSHFQSDI